jgi:hypothetical protein
MRSCCAAIALFALPALASGPSPAPTVGEACKPLPALKSPWAFVAGEQLDFELDALGAQAGSMSMRVLPNREGALPVEVRAETSPFFAKVRRVKGVGTSYLDALTLRPRRYTEESVENEVRRTANVGFRADGKAVEVSYENAGQAGRGLFHYENDGLDPAGAIYLFRQLPFREGLEVCFDVYGIRRLWRMRGKVEGKERVSLPVGVFDAWHLSGVAVRHDNPKSQKEVHVWISDDKRRLPLVAIGTMDLGAVRATLTGHKRPGEKRVRADGKESLKW